MTITTTTGTPATHQATGGTPPTTLHDLLPEIELTARVVEALAADNGRYRADEPPELAEVAASARALVVADRARDARRLAEIGAAWAAWDADHADHADHQTSQRHQGGV